MLIAGVCAAAHGLSLHPGLALAHAQAMVPDLTVEDAAPKQRRRVLSAGMIACHGKVQREGEVIHVVTDRLEDLSELLRSVGERDEPFPVQHGRGDGATHPGAPDRRDGSGVGLGRRAARDIYLPDLRLGSGIKVPTRDFR